MNRSNIKNNDEIVDQAIWNLFNILRTDVYVEDYSIILPCIYLHSKRIITDESLHNSEFKKVLIEIMIYEDEPIRKVFDVFLPSIERVRNETLIQVFETLFSINSDWIQKNLAVVFDKTLERIALSQGKIVGEFIQPEQLTRFVTQYIGSTKELNIYNPFAGVASFIKNMDGSIYAQELNQKTWAIGQLRLLIHNSKAYYKCEDSITNWPRNEKFDLIVSHPPFGVRLNKLFKFIDPSVRTIEEFLINYGIDSLNKTGKLIAVFPQGILFRGGSEKKLRERLVHEDLIDTIISFPGGILHNTGIPFIVLILNKAKKFNNRIKLINAEPYVINYSAKDNRINVDKLLEAVQSNENGVAVRIISTDDVIINDFNLNISRYFQEEVNGEMLENILIFFNGSRQDLPEIGHFVRIRDLKDDNVSFDLNLELVEEVPIKHSYRKIDTSCLLLAVKWKALKPTYFNYTGQPIFINSDILPIKVRDNVNISYLVNELHAKYVQDQLDAYRQGGTVPYIKKNDLVKIKIKLPSRKEQYAKVAGLLENSAKIKRLEVEQNEIIHGVRSNEFNEFASLKHTLGRPRQNILGWSKNLSKFFIRKKHAITSINNEFEDFFELGIIEAINEIKSDIEFISEVLERGEHGLVLNDYVKRIVSLSEINNLVNSLSSNNFNFTIKKQLLSTNAMKNRGILINEVLFKILIDNILTNADKYGFENNKESNHVLIELSDIKNYLLIEIKNNGLPFPKNYNREKFITKYSTSDSSNGSGLGGYDINRIATYFGNENWELDLNTDPIYHVIFRFSFPIELIK